MKFEKFLMKKVEEKAEGKLMVLLSIFAEKLSYF